MDSYETWKPARPHPPPNLFGAFPPPRRGGDEEDDSARRRQRRIIAPEWRRRPFHPLEPVQICGCCRAF